MFFFCAVTLEKMLILDWNPTGLSFGEQGVIWIQILKLGSWQLKTQQQKQKPVNIQGSFWITLWTLKLVRDQIMIHTENVCPRCHKKTLHASKSKTLFLTHITHLSPCLRTLVNVSPWCFELEEGALSLLVNSHLFTPLRRAAEPFCV